MISRWNGENKLCAVCSSDNKKTVEAWIIDIEEEILIMYLNLLYISRSFSKRAPVSKKQKSSPPHPSVHLVRPPLVGNGSLIYITRTPVPITETIFNEPCEIEKYIANNLMSYEELKRISFE